jgi:hypothetical protein
VYEIANKDLLLELVKVVTAPGTTITLDVELKRLQAKLLGQVAFELKTADVLDDSLTPVVNAWKALKVLDPIDARTFSSSGDAPDLVASRIDQANAILAAVGPTRPVSSQSALTTQPLSTQLSPTVTVVAQGMAAVVENPNPQVARVARLVPWQGSQSNRTVIDLPAPQLVPFEPDGSLSGGIPPDEAAALLKVGPFISVELVTAETPPDVGAQNRLDEIAAALTTAKLIPATATHALTKLRPKEKPLLSEGGINATEIVFLRKG